mgnify:CR=1 FL=1
MSNSRVSTWSGIRNKLENDYLCPALRGHIQYFATSYHLYDDRGLDVLGGSQKLLSRFSKNEPELRAARR